MSRSSHKGLCSAAFLLLGWLATMVSLLNVRVGQMSGWLVVTAVVLRTILQTGLFITGHDAMHGVLLPSKPRWNHRIGALTLALYAALPYRSCLANHQRHHRWTATAADPDFHCDPHAGVVRWYCRFMAGYLSRCQMAWLLVSWSLLVVLAHSVNPAAWLNVLVFCTLPLVLSSLQLFLFGTYLPHRRQRAPAHAPQPASLNLPPWLSLLACFHFGYHREHHDHPSLAWFELPAMRQHAQSRSLAPV